MATETAPKTVKALKVTKATKKAPEGTAKAKPANGHKKEGLRAPQVRVLACLAKSARAMSRKEISEKAPCDLAFLTDWIGSSDPAKRLANDVKPNGMTSLITLGCVKETAPENEEAKGTCYVITAAGRKALEKANKE